MKILLYTDNHFCETASIVNKYGHKYTVRLENQIASVNWVEELAINRQCDLVVCLGDFFDKQAITDQEITALNDIKFQTSIPHVFLVGNHESEEIDLKYNSTQVLARADIEIADTSYSKILGDTELCFLPYVTERNIKPLTEIFGERKTKKRVIFSHNDLAGVPMGAIISKSGFPLTDIEANCDLFLNGHIHSGSKISDKIYNLGNLTGKDFGEDASKTTHYAFILDTDTLVLTPIENPYALNFYQFTFVSEDDLNVLSRIKNNAVLKLTCRLPLITKLNAILDSISNKIVASKTITIQLLEDTTDSEANVTELTVDYLAELCLCCKAKLENTAILDYELAEICK